MTLRKKEGSYEMTPRVSLSFSLRMCFVGGMRFRNFMA